MSTLKIANYDRVLFDLLPHLPEYKSYSGGEGAAYFIDDKFVVKEYSKNFRGRDAEMFDDVFESYCREIQNFSKLGFSVPKIYAWLKIPNLNTDKVLAGDEMENKYYILEENVPGRWIYYFFEDLDEMYKACKKVCSKEKFESVMRTSGGRLSLKKEILRAYILDYLQMNERLVSMSNNELEKFITSAYYMAVGGVYSGPDLFRKNVLVTDSRIALIDNRVRNDKGLAYKGDIDEHFLVTLIDLIEYNKFMDDNMLLNVYNQSLYDDSIGKLVAENRKVCLALTQKIINILNSKMEIRPVSNKFIFDEIEMMVDDTFKEEAGKVMSMIQSEVEKG